LGTRGDTAQEIELTRDEFIALKGHLAVMRGYIDSYSQAVKPAA
jgi:hypothetical protein